MPATAVRDQAVIRRFAPIGAAQVGEDECEVTVCTSQLALDDDIWVMEGIDLSRYLEHPVVLRDHDMTQPVALASNLKVTAQAITARATFAPRGVSAKADETRGLVKCGFITGVSAGIIPLEAEPLDPRNPRGGRRITKAILVEWSFVSVPSDAASGVTARARGEIAVSDVQQAEDETVETEVPAPPEPQAPRKARKRANVVRGLPITFKRGLNQVAQLCYLFQELGYHVDCAAWEADREGDDSKVPAMLAAVFHDLGGVLITMTEEEVKEALAGCEVEPLEDDDDLLLDDADRAHIAAAKSPSVRAFRRGLAHAKLRAGKKLSKATVDALSEAQDHHDEAARCMRSAMAAHRKGKAVIADLIDSADAADDDDEDPDPAVEDDADDAAERSRRARAHQLKAKAAAFAD